MAETLTIVSGAGKKSRSFRVELVVMVTANRFWTGGTTSAHRPIWITVAETDAAVRAFCANMRTGRTAVLRSVAGHEDARPIETTRSSGVKWGFQRLASGVTLATGYLPALVALDLGLMPDRISFLFAPPTWWVDAQLAHPKVAVLPAAIRREVVVGAYLAAYLDKRSPFPIIPDPLFHRRLYLSLRKATGWWVTSGSPGQPGPFFVYPGAGRTLPGTELVALVDMAHEDFERILAEETQRYFKEESTAWLLAEEAPPSRRVSLVPAGLPRVAQARPVGDFTPGEALAVAAECPAPCPGEAAAIEEVAAIPELPMSAAVAEIDDVPTGVFPQPLPPAPPGQLSLFDW